MKVKKILALLSAASMLACMTACGDDKESSSKKSVETETVAAEADKNSSSDAAGETTEDKNTDAATAEKATTAAGGSNDINDIMDSYDKDNAQDTVISLLEKGFGASFGDNMKVDYDESTQTYELAVWQNGFAAALDTEAGVSALNAMSTQLTSALKTMETQIQVLDSKAKLKFSFLSDKDQETPLLVIENGEISYDISKDK